MTAEILIPAITLEGRPLEPMSLEEFAAAIEQLSAFPGATPTLEPFRTRARHWQIVLPEEASSSPSTPEIEAALEPLIQLRRDRDQRSVYFRAERDLASQRALLSWWERNARQLRDGAILLAGSAKDLPFALQRFLSSSYRVGRLSLPTREAYATYAEKVRAAERRAVRPAGRPIVGFAPDFDAATHLGRTSVLEPVLRELRDRQPRRPQHRLVDVDATRDRLLAALAGVEAARPSLLFSVGHGLEHVDPAFQDIGALCDQMRRFVRADDFSRERTVLPDGMAVLFACNSAGTSGLRPSLPRPGWRPAPSSEPDHVAALPTALLSHPTGPLAVIGHVDLIYALSLGDVHGELPTPDNDPGIDPLKTLLVNLAENVSAGEAMFQLRARAGSYSELTRHLLEKHAAARRSSRDEILEQVRAWMTMNDLRGWVLLGDPGVKLEGGKPTRQETFRGAVRG